MNINKEDINKQDSWQMFNDISLRYDLLNRLLSWGIDGHWRKCLVKFLSLSEQKNVLDMATGTGDVLLTLVKHEKNITEAVGIDRAGKMLQIGRSKIEKRGFLYKIRLQQADAAAVPIETGHFENVTMAFGIRNMPDPVRVLKEMCRLLSPNGHAIILEFSLPTNPLLRSLHLSYLRVIVPVIGGAITGRPDAYRYLNQTIESFPYGVAFCSMMQEAGFSRSSAYPLLGGIATIYLGEK